MTAGRPFLSSLAAVAYTCLGGLVAIGVLVPQLHARDRVVGRLRANERVLAERCHIYVNGSARCPAGVFDVPTTTTTEAAK